MAFMIPVAEYMETFEVETSDGTETVPADVLSSEELSAFKRRDYDRAFRNYVQGFEIYEAKKKKGWYSRLSAPGYLDATEWMGPFKTANKALKEVMDFYEVDENGDPIG